MGIKQTRLYRTLSKYKSQWEYNRKIASIKRSLGTTEKFSKDTIIPNNTIIIVECNPFHAETLPGHIKYFLEAGYNVDVFMTYERASEKPFERMGEEFRLFIGEQKEILKWITYDNMGQYEIIFFNTLFYNAEMKFLPSTISPDLQNKILGIEHTLEAHKEWVKNNPCHHDFDKMLKEKRIATLSNTEGLYRINPNYFGNIKVKNKGADNNKIIFIAVGVSKRTKNHNLIIDAVRNLQTSNITNFEVHVIGITEMAIPDDLKEHIVLCGRLDFPTMYTEIENADFILALLDPYNETHKIYLNGCTSGSLQLSYGFLKPLVINSRFAEAYSLTSDNAVIYDGNALYGAMLNAIDMTQEQYGVIQKSIEIKRNDIRKESLDALKEMISITK